MPGCAIVSASMITPQENSPPMVEVKNVTLRFNLVEAVKDVSFHVDKGNIFGLVGSDGAGKSTLLRLIATMIKPTQGEIFVGGLNVVAQRQKIKNMIGYMPQRFGLYQDLTVDENMNFFMDIFGIPRKERKSAKRNIWDFPIFCLLWTGWPVIFPEA